MACLEEPVHARVASTVPTLLTKPTIACPRCDGPRVIALAVSAENAFAWHECEDCRYLWALPNGWTVRREAYRTRLDD